MKRTKHTRTVGDQASYPALPLCWVTLRKSLQLSGPLFPHLWNGIKHKPSQPGIQEGQEYGLASAGPCGEAFYNTDPICNEFVFLLRISTTNIPAGRQHIVKAKTMRAAHERMRVKQGSFLASPAWPQPRLPLGQSCYASLPFKQMRKCSSSLPTDLFGPEPRQVSFQSMRPRVPLTQPLLTLCHPARHSRATHVQGTKVFFQSHNHLQHL